MKVCATVRQSAYMWERHRDLAVSGKPSTAVASSVLNYQNELICYERANEMQAESKPS